MEVWLSLLCYKFFWNQRIAVNFRANTGLNKTLSWGQRRKTWGWRQALCFPEGRQGMNTWKLMVQVPCSHPFTHTHVQTHIHAHTHICTPTESPTTPGMRDIHETKRHHACPYKAFCFEGKIGPESVLSGVKKGEKLGQKGLLGRGRVWDAFRILAYVFLRNHSTFPFNLLTPGFGLCAG